MQPESMPPRIRVILRAASFYPNRQTGSIPGLGPVGMTYLRTAMLSGRRGWTGKKTIQDVDEGDFYQGIQQGGRQAFLP